MRPPGDAAGGLLHDGSSAAEELDDEPEEEDNTCRERGACPKTNERGDESIDTMVREEGEVGTEHTCNRAGGSEHWDVTSEEEREFGSCRNDAGNEIEDKELSVTEVSLDVIAEDPEIPHVGENVDEASVEEWRCEEGDKATRVCDVQC